MNWDYIAGFMDGEGSIIKKPKRNGFRIMIPQTNEEVLEKIKQFVGSGFIYEVKKRKTHWKDSWMYAITSNKGVYNFLLKAGNKLIVKKKLANKAVKIIKDLLKKEDERINLRKHRIKKAKKMRGTGYTYRQIGKALKIDFGYARRIILLK